MFAEHLWHTWLDLIMVAQEFMRCIISVIKNQEHGFPTQSFLLRNDGLEFAYYWKQDSTCRVPVNQERVTSKQDIFLPVHILSALQRASFSSVPTARTRLSSAPFCLLHITASSLHSFTYLASSFVSQVPAEGLPSVISLPQLLPQVLHPLCALRACLWRHPPVSHWSLF